MGGSKRYAVFMGVAVLCTAGPVLARQLPAGPETPKITLGEAISRSNRVQPRVIQANGTILNAAARLRAASGAFLPNLNLNASGSNTFSEGARVDNATGELLTSGTTNQSIGTSISSSVDLFAGFRRTGEKRAANANQDAAEAGLSDALFQNQLTTTNAFFDVLAAQELLRVREASVRRAEEQLKVAVAKLQAGRGIRPDSLRSLVTLGNTQLQQLNAIAALATAEANLGRLVGENGPVGAVDDSTLYRTLPSVETAALRTEAVANSPTVKAAEAQAGASRAAITVAKAAYFPTLTLSGSANLDGSRSQDYTLLKRRSFQLQMSWPIFNRFQREQSVANANVNADNAEATAAEARRQVYASLTAALAALETARLRIGITQTSVAAAQEDLRVQQDRYRLGASTIVDLLTSQEALNQAEVDAVTARFDYVRAKAQISALIGRTL
ncbi:MAG: TolC family protein [Gemmatimonadales bacterium]|nr:TolC family protein [Gemmatimonadales bacterium]